MIIKFVLLLVAVILFLTYFRLLIKGINDLLKIKSDDIDIKATVVSIVPHMTGNVQPILQYEIDGVVKKYIYNYYCHPEKYLIGDEVSLKLSKKNDLVYDKEDLIKGLLLRLSITTVFACVVLYLGCDILTC